MTTYNEQKTNSPLPQLSRTEYKRAKIMPIDTAVASILTTTLAAQRVSHCPQCPFDEFGVLITQETILGFTHSLRHVSTSDPRGGRALLTDELDTCAQDSISKLQGPPCVSSYPLSFFST
nr:unnamed protein product [Spirometra erinaceieuropaei]